MHLHSITAPALDIQGIEYRQAVTLSEGYPPIWKCESGSCNVFSCAEPIPVQMIHEAFLLSDILPNALCGADPEVTLVVLHNAADAHVL